MVMLLSIGMFLTSQPSAKRSQYSLQRSLLFLIGDNLEKRYALNDSH